LEKLTDRSFVETIIYQEYDRPITFKEYPHDASYLLNLRKRVNREISKRMEK
jgi:hypothetical protein